MSTPIWHNANPPTPAQLTALGAGNMGEWLGIAFTEIGPDYLKAQMPIDHRTTQPYGLLHGGASVVLAETVGSIASALCVDISKYQCVGVEVNANHLRGGLKGYAIATCRPLRIGRTLHVWQIDIENQKGQLLCTSRLTVAVIEKKYGE